MENYELGEVIGHGGFSTVYKARNKIGDFFAIKVAQIDEQAQKSHDIEQQEDPVLVYDLPRIEREIYLWKPLDHDNLCRLIDVFLCEKEKKVYFVMEYADEGDLLTYIEGKGLSCTKVKEFFKQLCEAVFYLHEQGIVHGDVKLENILIKEDRVKLSDFGLARRAREVVFKTNCGTVEYAAPELFKTDCVDLFKADVWALGVVLYSLLYQHFPFNGSNVKDLKTRITAEEPRYKALEGATELIELTKRLLDKKAERRPSIESILQALH